MENEENHDDPYEVLQHMSLNLGVGDVESLAYFLPDWSADLENIVNNAGESGDLLTLTAQTLVIVVERLGAILRTIGKKACRHVECCFRKIVALVSHNSDWFDTLVFQQCTLFSLEEEILGCLSNAVKYDFLVNSLPDVRDQLNFCHRVAAHSTWLSCKALSHLSLLTRTKIMTDERDIFMFKQMLSKQLTMLSESTTVAFDWDELLRNITLSVVTLTASYHCGPVESSGVAKGKRKEEKQKKNIGSKRPRRDESFNKFSAPIFTQELIGPLFRVLLAIGKPSCPDARLSLILASIDTIVTQPLGKENILLDPSTQEEVVLLLQDVLHRRSDVKLGLSNPFVRSSLGSRSDASDEWNEIPDGTKLNWILPSIKWCALVVLLKVLGGHVPIKKEYIWGYTSENNEPVIFRAKHRIVLTKEFFSGASKTSLQGEHRTVDMRRFTTADSREMITNSLHFQPAASHQRLGCGASLLLPRCIEGEAQGSSFLNQYASFKSLYDVLRNLSTGLSAESRLARLLRVHIVSLRMNADDMDDEGRFFFLREVAIHGGPTDLVNLGQRLVKRDPRWGDALRTAGLISSMPPPGVSPSIQASSGTKSPQGSTFIHDGSVRRSPSRTVSPMLVPTPVRVSPGIETLPSVPEKFLEPLGSFNLPPSTRNSLREALGRVCSVESLAKLNEKMTRAAEGETHIATIKEELSALKGDKSFGTSLEALLHRELQQLLFIHEKKDIIKEAQGDLFPQFSIGICRAESDAAVSCPQGHPLKIFRGLDWTCDQCKAKKLVYASYACRACNYDLCHHCYESSSRSILVNSTASMRDLLREWIGLHVSEPAESGTSTASTTASDALLDTSVLFTENGFLPMTAPSHMHPSVHVTQPGKVCSCGISVKPTVYHAAHVFTADTFFSAALQTLDDTLFEQERSNEILLDLFAALEHFGGAIAIFGVAGLPPQLHQVLTGLSHALPKATKREICHFFSVGCIRFAAEAMLNAQVTFPGVVHLPLEAAGISTSVKVPRGDSEGLTQALLKKFLTNPSIVGRVGLAFIGEVGTGNGPTQEVYSELHRLYLQEKNLWYAKDENSSFLPCPSRHACFPAQFYLLGAACGRGFADGYLQNIHYLPAVWGLVREGAAVASPFHHSLDEKLWELLRELDEQLFQTFSNILRASADELEAMDLVFDNGTVVTLETVQPFICERVKEHFSMTLQNIYYFTLGLSTCVDLNAFWFVPNEDLNAIFSGISDDGEENSDKKLFTAEELSSVIEEAHGYEQGSPIVAQLVDIIGNSFNRLQQMNFVEFLTGIPSLPMTGIRGFEKKITVVKKDMEGEGERTLPSCNTCFLYLKLPPYSSKEIMRERLLLAITEGRRNYSMS